MLCCYGFCVFFTCFWMGIASVIYNWDLCFHMVHFVGLPVMCSDMLQSSMHGVCSSIQTRNRYPVLKGYVVVFLTTAPFRSLDLAVSAFRTARCRLVPRKQQWNTNSSRIMEVLFVFKGQVSLYRELIKIIAKWYLMLHQMHHQILIGTQTALTL